MDINHLMNTYDNYRHLHKQDEDIPLVYRNLSLHIAVERADMNKDWTVFKKLYTFAPEFLKAHLKTTEYLLGYNYLDLDKKDRDELFKL
jgi:hypothetical protein